MFYLFTDSRSFFRGVHLLWCCTSLSSGRCCSSKFSKEKLLVLEILILLLNLSQWLSSASNLILWKKSLNLGQRRQSTSSSVMQTYALTSKSNINRFSKCFRCRNQGKIRNNAIIKDSSTPQVCRYIIGCLHDPANVQHCTCFLSTFAESFLDVCWIV